MRGVLREYRLDPKHVDEVVERITEGGVPILRAIPGFVQYTMNDAGGGYLRTVTVYENATGTQESSRRAAEWVREHIAHLLPNPPTATEGEVVVRHVTGEPKFGVLRRYRTDPQHISTIVQRARDGFVPIVSALPGFASYTMLDPGDGRLLTFSGFTSRSGADESVQAAASWIRENLSQLLPNPPEVTSGPMRLWVTASSPQGAGPRTTSQTRQRRT